MLNTDLCVNTHLVEQARQVHPEVCSAGPEVSEHLWTGAGCSSEKICGPASPAHCRLHFPYRAEGPRGFLDQTLNISNMFLTRLKGRITWQFKESCGVWCCGALYKKMTRCTSVCFEFLVLTQGPAKTSFRLTTSPLETVSHEATPVRSNRCNNSHDHNTNHNKSNNTNNKFSLSLILLFEFLPSTKMSKFD